MLPPSRAACSLAITLSFALAGRGQPSWRKTYGCCRRLQHLEKAARCRCYCYQVFLLGCYSTGAADLPLLVPMFCDCCIHVTAIGLTLAFLSTRSLLQLLLLWLLLLLRRTSVGTHWPGLPPFSYRTGRGTRRWCPISRHKPQVLLHHPYPLALLSPCPVCAPTLLHSSVLLLFARC